MDRHAAYVAEAPVAFECTLYDAHGVGGSTMVLGEVVRAHVEEDLLTDGQFDVTEFDALGRLTGEFDAVDEVRDRVHAAGGEVTEIRSHEPTLEDVFLEITGDPMRVRQASEERDGEPIREPIQEPARGEQ